MKMGLISKVLGVLAVLYFCTDGVSPYCIFDGTIDHLRINSPKSPLIYSYFKKPEIHYPSTDGCIWKDNPIRRLHIACPSSRICYTQQTQLAENCTYKESPTYLRRAETNEKLIMQGERVKLEFHNDNDHIECEEPIEPSMVKIGKSKHDKLQIYSVGYQLNEVDFLTVYRVFDFVGSLYVYTTLIASAQTRPESTEVNELKEGLIYAMKDVNFTEIYDQDSQIMKFNETLQDEDLVNEYFLESNYLVPGRLIDEKDFYFIPQQRSTLYYENTYPVWSSIYETGGNWNLISDLIRHLADSSAKDYKIIAVGLGELEINGKKMYLGGTATSPGKIRIPRVLAKVAIDDRKHSRGIVYYTANDPRMTRAEMDKVMLGTNSTKGYCKKLLDCNKMHSEFDDAARGLTYCCSPKDSKIWDEIDKEELTLFED